MAQTSTSASRQRLTFGQVVLSNWHLPTTSLAAGVSAVAGRSSVLEGDPDHRVGGAVSCSSDCGQTVELLQRRHMVELTTRRITIDQPDQPWLQLLVHVPDRLKQSSSDGEVIAAFNGVGSAFTLSDCDLPLGGKPKVHPERQIHEDDRVRKDHSVFKR